MKAIIDLSKEEVQEAKTAMYNELKKAIRSTRRQGTAAKQARLRSVIDKLSAVETVILIAKR